MIVSDVIADAKQVFGICSQAKLFSFITDAVDVLSTHGDFDPLLGSVDICTDGRFVSLPRDVETILALNIGGKPALARDQLFTYHYNGPGDCDWHEDCSLRWQDLGKYPTFRDIKCPSKVVAFVDNQEDADKEVWVYGLDEQGHEVRTQIGGEWKNGYLVPTIFGYALPASDAPSFSRITAIRKEDTVGSIRISSFDNSTFTGTLLAVMEWDDNEAWYRRIKLSRNCGDNIRIFFRRRVFKVRSLEDGLPVMSRPALKMMFMSMKYYDEADAANAEFYEATAARMETQKQLTSNPPTQTPIQVDDSVSVQDKRDDID